MFLSVRIQSQNNYTFKRMIPEQLDILKYDP